MKTGVKKRFISMKTGVKKRFKTLKPLNAWDQSPAAFFQKGRVSSDHFHERSFLLANVFLEKIRHIGRKLSGELFDNDSKTNLP